MLVVLAWQAVEGQRLLDRLLGSGHQARIARLPLGNPGGQIPPGFLDRAAVVEPAQLLQAVIIGLARQVIEGIAEEVLGSQRACSWRLAELHRRSSISGTKSPINVGQTFCHAQRPVSQSA